MPFNFLYTRQNEITKTNEVEKRSVTNCVNNFQYRIHMHVNTISYSRRHRLSHAFLSLSSSLLRSHARRRSSDNNYYRQITDRIHLSRPGELTKQRRRERRERERQIEWEWETTAVIWPLVIGYIVPMNWYVINIDWLRAAELASSSVELKGWARSRGRVRSSSRFLATRLSGAREKSRWSCIRTRERTCPMGTKGVAEGRREREREDANSMPRRWCMRLSRDAQCERAA